MRRLVATCSVLVVSLALLAPTALANDHGEGTYGPVSEKNITNAGFIVIIFFPLLVLALSLLQWKLDQRKARRKAATKKLDADWNGGW
jgi:hypothetical protein